MLFTSALAEEGKSTTLANLGIALALAGKSVALVDLDLHRPMVVAVLPARQRSQPGISSVVLGMSSSTRRSYPSGPTAPERARAAGEERQPHERHPPSGRHFRAGALFVLPTGALPPDPGEFVGLESVRHVSSAPCATGPTSC